MMRSVALAFALSIAGLSAAHAACGDPPGLSADWHSCDKSNQNLNLANLPAANLNGANLSNANMYGANLANANLTGANLTGAALSHANLTGASIANATLSGADFTGATWTDGKKVCAPGSMGACK